MERTDPRGAAKLTALVRLCHDLAAATSIEGMFSSVAEALVADTGLQRASVLTFDDQGVMRFRASHGLSAEYKKQVDCHSPWSPDEPNAQRILVADVMSDPFTEDLRPVFAKENVRALAFLPLIGNGRLLGKFMLYSERPMDWNTVDLTFAGAAADVLASFILREQGQERLQQARRMESLGLLAGGIAHDFNNLLTAILGYVDLLRQETLRGTPSRDYADELLTTVEQASELTRQLLGFARPQTATADCVDVTAFLGEVQPMLARLCGDAIALRVDAPSTPAYVRGNRTQLLQLLTNLVGNARDAMPDGGTVTISMRTQGQFVELEVADTGLGMDEAVRRRVFEPLFTTKSPGRGTGLGLATCYAIVVSLGGEISVRSTPGHGSVFSMTVPLASEERTDGRDAERDGEHATSPSASVLLVEDQPHVAKALTNALQAAGYRVAVVENGRRALEALDREPVDVVVTDVVMPELSGIELAQELAVRRPGLPVLLITGYVDGAHQLPAGAPVLFKPFLPRELCHRIAQLLLARPSRSAAS